MQAVSQSQVFEMQGGEVFFELLSRQGSAGKTFLGAALEGSGESLTGEAPATGFGLRVKPFQLGRGQHQPWAWLACIRRPFCLLSGLGCVLSWAIQVFTVWKGIQRPRYPRHPRSLIQPGRNCTEKYGRCRGRIAVSYTGCALQPRNKNRLAGLADWVQTVRSRDH